MKIFYIVIIFIFLLKNPFQIYLLLGSIYKFLYALLFGLILSLYHKVKKKYINSFIIAYYYIFIIVLFIIIVSSLFQNEIKLIVTIQLLANILLFFVLYLLIIKIKDILLILKLLNILAVVLSIFSLIAIYALWNGIDIFPRIIFHPTNNPDGVVFMFPLTFLKNTFDNGYKFYRSYSYFTEPAGFAFFLLPFLFYNLVFYKQTNNMIYLLSCVLIIFALITTQSTAAIGAFVISTLVYILLYSRKTTKIIAILIILLVAVYVFSCLLNLDDNNIIIKRRLLSISNRLGEWTAFVDAIAEHPFGYGLGHIYNEIYIWDEIQQNYIVKTGVTNILLYVQAYGIIFFIPLIMYILFIINLIFCLTKNKSDYFSQVITMLLISSMLFFISISFIFSPVFILYVVISIYYCKYKSIIHCKDSF